MFHPRGVHSTRDPWLSHTLIAVPRTPLSSAHSLPSSQMEKEEETTRELLLPNWQGSGSHGLTIAQRDDGVFVQEVMQNSPAARTGVVKEGESSRCRLGAGLGWVRVEGWAGGRQKWARGCGGPGPSAIRVVSAQALPSCLSLAHCPQGRWSCGWRHNPRFRLLLTSSVFSSIQGVAGWS